MLFLLVETLIQRTSKTNIPCTLIDYIQCLYQSQFRACWMLKSSWPTQTPCFTLVFFCMFFIFILYFALCLCVCDTFVLFWFFCYFSLLIAFSDFQVFLILCFCKRKDYRAEFSKEMWWFWKDLWKFEAMKNILKIFLNKKYI